MEANVRTTFLWPLKSYKVLIVIDAIEVSKSNVQALLRDTLIKLASVGGHRFNFLLIGDQVIKWCESYIDCTKFNVDLSLDWLDRNSRECLRNARIRKPDERLIYLLLGEEASDVYLVSGVRIPFTVVHEECLLDRLGVLNMSKSIHARLLIVGRRGNEDNTEECHKALNYREQSSADFLRCLAQCTCGTFAVLRTSQRRRDCDAGCIVWPVLKNRPSKEREFYTHMMMDTESVDTVASISGRIYPKWTKDYQPVLMSRTLACCPHPCKTEIQDKSAQETCVGDGCIGCLECTPHYHSPCRWTRTCINKRLVKDLNCRLRMCAEREADTNQWWLAWSAQDLRTYKLLEGRRVLARRKQNGQFYLGRIFKVESGDTADRAIICFGAFRSTSHAPHCHKDVGECSDAYIFESIPVTDLIDLAHALRHPIRPGDKVLVPCLWASGRCAQHSSQHCKTIKQVMYQAGTVISGRENRSQSRSNTFDSDSTLDDSSELVIELAPSNRQVGCHCVPSNRAIWIPPGVFERITLEQHMPANSRQWLRDKAFIPYTYPVGSAPGYPRDGDYKWLQTCKCYHNPHTVKGPVDYCQFHCGPELQVDYGLKSKCWPLIPVTEALMANPKGGYSSWNSKKETGTFPPGAKICPDHCCHCWKKHFCPVHNRSKRQRRRKRRHMVECDTLLDADCHIHGELDTPHSA